MTDAPPGTWQHHLDPVLRKLDMASFGNYRACLSPDGARALASSLRKMIAVLDSLQYADDDPLLGDEAPPANPLPNEDERE